MFNLSLLPRTGEKNNDNNSALSTERILFTASNFHNSLNAKQDVLYLQQFVPIGKEGI